ncbi:YeeE/YedE family protein [Roseobacter sp. HKCCA0434]|uniref:YeeE/YedE family protein n=1 Tax=Roseobacter sp. HKCCA0434 TaxID=3079297 RepID=UPI0029058A39|nr:YeeE/YedE family protein [Roseobacter sp. HKCCA0434]
MLLEMYDFGLEARSLHLIAGLVLGLVFGIAAQASRFCLRRAVAGPVEERGSAAAVWLSALATAIAGFGILSATGLVDLGGHRFLSSEIPVTAIILGGLAFGVGMVLTRGCASRLTVLSATGNLRALVVLLAFAVTAHATLKGIVAPVRVNLSAMTVDFPLAAVAQTPFGIALFAVPVILAAGVLVWRTRPGVLNVVFGIAIGLVAIGGWAATSVLLLDEFDPMPVQSAAFTSTWSDTLFWTIASTATPAGFGVGFVGGVLAGSFLSATIRRELRLESFETAGQTLRYVAGGMMMGFGGVLAGGCTVGAGLSGVATGSIAAILALVSIALGGWAAGNLNWTRRAVPATA